MTPTQFDIFESGRDRIRYRIDTAIDATVQTKETSVPLQKAGNAVTAASILATAG